MLTIAARNADDKHRDLFHGGSQTSFPIGLQTAKTQKTLPR